MTKMKIEEAMRHAGNAINSESVRDRVLEVIPHYIWTEGSAKKRRGFCTSCMTWCKDLQELPEYVIHDPYAEDYASKFETSSSRCENALDTNEYNESVTGKTKHLDYGWCPLCGARVQYRSLAIGRKQLRDEMYLVTYRKSAIEKDALVCVGYWIDVPWGEMENESNIIPPLHMSSDQLCVFRYGKGGDRFIKETNGFSAQTNRWEYGWKHRRECKSGFCPGLSTFGYLPNRYMALDITAYQNAIQGTAFEKVLCDPIICHTEAGKRIDRISLVHKVTRYPCIEYMLRLGLNRLARDVIDRNCGNVLNMRGKTAKKVLRLSDGQWSEVKGKRLDIGVNALEAASFGNRIGWRAGMELYIWIGEQYYGIKHTRQIAKQLPKEAALKALKYIKKNSKWKIPGCMLTDYLDYIDQLHVLGMPLNKENLYPREFHEMHTRLSTRVQYKQNADKDTHIAKHAEALSEYCFSAYGLMLRPMTSSAEIIDEGTALCHCVGSYVDSYANGRTVLCALRDENKPSVPMYTVEFATNGNMIQCRGYKNRTKPEDRELLAKFWELFKTMRTELKRKIEKENKALQKERNAA